MPFLTFDTGPNYYGYEQGVNAANLTSKDIKAANARLAPMRQQRIEGGLIKATRDDPAYAASKSVAPNDFFDYAKWTKYEMLDAMVARGLATKWTRVKDMNKEKMVARLVKADKASSFHRFLDLAPELRVMIYAYAFDNNKARTRPAPPPICRVNQEIRNESLPVFFENVTMNVHVFEGDPWEKPYDGDYSVVVGARSMHISKTYLEYFAYAAKHRWIKHMRRFQWYVSTHDSLMPGHERKHRTDIFQFKFSRFMETLQREHLVMKREYHMIEKKKNGRLVSLSGETVKFGDGDKMRMTDRFGNMLTSFMGAKIDLKRFERG